jgi:uncharacterized integral membrane protein
MFHVALVLIIIVLVAVFSVQNADPVKFKFLLWEFDASLAIVIFLSALTGLIAGVIITFLIRFKTKKSPEALQ